MSNRTIHHVRERPLYGGVGGLVGVYSRPVIGRHFFAFLPTIRISYPVKVNGKPPLQTTVKMKGIFKTSLFVFLLFIYSTAARRGGSSGGGRSGGGQRGGKPKSSGGQLPRAPRNSTPKQSSRQSQKSLQSKQDESKPGYTYELNLKDGKKYVGYTANPSKNLQQHFQGKGSKWTEKHPPKSVSYIKKHESIEAAKKAETKEYYASKNKHGADNVRGAGNTRSVP